MPDGAFADAVRKTIAANPIFYADADTGQESLDEAFFKAMRSPMQ